MITLLLPAYELKQLITTCFLFRSNVFWKSCSPKIEAVSRGHNSMKGNFVICVR